MGGDDYVVDENGGWNRPNDALDWYRSALKRERENSERLRTALSDLLRQIQGCDGTAQLSIEQAEAALKTLNSRIGH